MAADAGYRCVFVSGHCAGMGLHGGERGDHQRGPGMALPRAAEHLAVEDRRLEVAVGEFDFSKQPRALAMLKAEGRLRIYAERGTGRLLGAEMLIPAAEHIGHLLALAVQREMSVAELLTLPFYHPVLEEGLRSALRPLAKEVYGEAPLELAKI